MIHTAAQHQDIWFTFWKNLCGLSLHGEALESISMNPRFHYFNFQPFPVQSSDDTDVLT